MSVSTKDWSQLIAQERLSPPRIVEARISMGCPFASRGKPTVFSAQDGQLYVVKSNHDVPYRFTVNDAVASKLGMLLGGPVLDAVLVNIDPGLIKLDAELSHVRSGVCYATPKIKLTDRLRFEYAHLPENGIRLATLAILYGWIGVCGDHQLMYSASPPELVFSIDHEESIVCGGQWKLPLDSSCVAAEPHAWIKDNSMLASRDIEVVVRRLASVTPQQVASAVAFPPDEWCITNVERIELAKYIWSRKSSLCASRRIVLR